MSNPHSAGFLRMAHIHQPTDCSLPHQSNFLYMSYVNVAPGLLFASSRFMQIWGWLKTPDHEKCGKYVFTYKWLFHALKVDKNTYFHSHSLGNHFHKFPIPSRCTACFIGMTMGPFRILKRRWFNPLVRNQWNQSSTIYIYIYLNISIY